MLKLNRMTDYAVVTLGHLARKPGVVTTAAAVARGTALTPPTVSRLLKQLAAASLVTSHRGASGGYSLNRTAAQVRVSEIIEALDGPIALTACVDGADDQCDVEALCPMRGNWNRVNNAIRAALEEVTLADLIDPDALFPTPAVAPNPAVTSSPTSAPVPKPATPIRTER